jgi:hypothetical protein
MATLTWHRTPVPFAAGVSPALPKPTAKCFTLSSTASATSSGMKILAIKCPRGALVIWVVRSDLRDTVHKSRILQRKFGPTNQPTAAGQQGAKTRLPSAHPFEKRCGPDASTEAAGQSALVGSNKRDAIHGSRRRTVYRTGATFKPLVRKPFARKTMRRFVSIDCAVLFARYCDGISIDLKFAVCHTG